LSRGANPLRKVNCSRTEKLQTSTWKNQGARGPDTRATSAN
jgi:hypothetical protein